MPVNARATTLYIVAALAVAAAVHLGTVWYLPNMIMSRAMAQMGAVNTIHHGQRATAAIHGVVRPSPDLLYSVCPFDLSKGPLRVTAPVPAGTYWSVSMFDAKTNNFFVRNDTQVKGGKIDLLVTSADASGVEPYVASEKIAYYYVAPEYSHGLVVFRTLVNDESKFAQIDAARRKANCTVY